MSDSNKKISSSEWDALIQDYRNSGLSAAKWCENHGFKKHQTSITLINEIKLKRMSKQLNGSQLTQFPLQNQ